MADRGRGANRPYRNRGGGNYGEGRSYKYSDDYDYDYYGYKDEYYGRRDYYDSKNPNPRERGIGKRGKQKGRSKDRPNSSQSNRGREQEANDSDASTQSEPAIDKRADFYSKEKSSKPSEKKVITTTDSNPKQSRRDKNNPGNGRNMKPAPGVINSEKNPPLKSDPFKEKQLDKSKSASTKDSSQKPITNDKDSKNPIPNRDGANEIPLPPPPIELVQPPSGSGSSPTKHSAENRAQEDNKKEVGTATEINANVADQQIPNSPKKDQLKPLSAQEHKPELDRNQVSAPTNPNTPRQPIPLSETQTNPPQPSNPPQGVVTPAPIPNNSSKNPVNPPQEHLNTDAGDMSQQRGANENLTAVQPVTKPDVDSSSIDANSETLGSEYIIIDPSQKHTSGILAKTAESIPELQDMSTQAPNNPPPDPPAAVANEDITKQIHELTMELESERERNKEAAEREMNIIQEKTQLDLENNDLGQRIKEIGDNEKKLQAQFDELNKEKIELKGEKEKALADLATSQKESIAVKNQLQQVENQSTSQISFLAGEKQTAIKQVEGLQRDLLSRTQELEEKKKNIEKLQATNSDLLKNMEKSQGAEVTLVHLENQIGEKDAELKRLETQLQNSNRDKAEFENASRNEIQELTEQLRTMSEEETALKAQLSQFEIERTEDSRTDIELLSKIEETFLSLCGYRPSDLSPGSAERVEWLVASMTSWNAELNTKISDFERLLYEKDTNIEMNLREIQEINSLLQHHQIRPTQLSSSATNSSARPIDLIQTLLAGKDDQLKQFENQIQSLELQMEELRQHYNTEDSKNDQLMQDNADLERRVQTLMSEKDELERKNVELENRLTEIQEDLENSNDPNGPQSHMNPSDPMLERNTMNSRPSPIHLGPVNTLPFEPSTPPPYSALSTLSQGHRSTLQKAADELSQLKVKVWELEDESCKLKEHLTVRNRDSTIPANISPVIEAPFQAVFAANQSNILKLSECNREKEALYKDLEFLRKRVEELEVCVERYKLSIEVKEVAYKELYEECRDWERKYRKCGHMQHEMEKMKRQLFKKDAETQECARLRAERLEQQTTLDNLLAELQERKKAEMILQTKNQKMLTRIEEFQSQARQEFVITPTEHQRIPHAHEIPQPDPHPTSPPILKPPTLSSVPLSPPTRQPAKRHPQILYPPTNN